MLLQHAKRSGVPVSAKSTMMAEDFACCKCVHAPIVNIQTQSLLRQFFEIDDNSCLTLGKKNTVTRNKVRKQKQLFTDTLLNFHDKYCAEMLTILSHIPHLPKCVLSRYVLQQRKTDLPVQKA